MHSQTITHIHISSIWPIWIQQLTNKCLSSGVWEVARYIKPFDSQAVALTTLSKEQLPNTSLTEKSRLQQRSQGKKLEVLFCERRHHLWVPKRFGSLMLLSSSVADAGCGNWGPGAVAVLLPQTEGLGLSRILAWTWGGHIKSLTPWANHYPL